MADSTTNFDIRFKTTADLAAAKQVKDSIDGIANAQNKASGSGRNMGNAMLQASRGLQDFAAAGLPGIINNVEGIAAGLGMGAGIAGAATVAAVAIQAIGPHILNLINALIPLDDALGKTAAKLEQDAVEAGQAYVAAVDNAGKQTKAFEDRLKAEQTALDNVNTAIDRQVKLLEARAKIQAMIADAQTQGRIEDIKASGLPPQEEARRIAEEQIKAQQQKAAIEEKQRQDAMTGAQGKYANDIIASTNADENFKREQKKKEDAAQFALNEAEIAKAKNSLKYTNMAGDMTAAEWEAQKKRDKEIKADIARREKYNADILARNGGQSPTALPQDQINVLKQQADQLKAQFMQSMKEVADLALQQQIEREKAAAQRAAETDKIAKDYTKAAYPGLPVFNDPNAGDATGRPYVTPQLPGAGMPTRSPLDGGFLPPLGAPLGGPSAPDPFFGRGYAPTGPSGQGSPLDTGLKDLAAPVQRAADAIQGSPLNLADALGKPLETIATAYTNQRKEVADLTTRLKTVEAQVKNTR